MNERTTRDQWHETLEACVADMHDRGLRAFTNVTVLTETMSTQDAASGAAPGRIVAALRQTGGRGRQGKAWIDDQGRGIAATFVVPADHSGRLAIVAAVAAAQSISAVLPRSSVCGIKWPNDVLINRRKVAGVLIEQDDVAARIGIGINVHQEHWPAEIAQSAISLEQAGAKVSRTNVLKSLVATLAQRLQDDDASLVGTFQKFDLLHGACVDLKQLGETTRGRIMKISPLDRIEFQPDEGSRLSIPVAEATIVSVVKWPEYAPDSSR